MQRLQTPGAARSRRGFTLIELLVVISIIVVLMSLIAPAVQNARKAARRAECMSQMRNIGIAMQNFSTSNNGRLPLLYRTQQVTATYDNAGALLTTSVTGVPLLQSWVVDLLPSLDQQATFKKIKTEAKCVDMACTAAVVNDTENIWMQVLTCPEDQRNFRLNGGLSYVVNAGYVLHDPMGGATNFWGSGAQSSFSPTSVDWDGDGTYGLTTMGTIQPADSQDVARQYSTGVFFPAVTGDNFRMSLDYISNGDGLGNTVMVSENLQAQNWLSAAPDNHSFSYAMQHATRIPTLGGAMNPHGFNASGMTGRTLQTFNDSTGGTGGDLGVSAINRNPGADPGQTPRPSSNHGQVVNVVMCDGSAKSLNESMDSRVYMKLLSSNGQQYGQRTVSQTDF